MSATVLHSPGSRLEQRIRAAVRDGRKAMGIFLTGGFPEPSATVPLLRAIDEGGADFIELGMPFSDPLAEGLPIQHASERALRAGASMKHTLESAARFRESSDTPIVLMGYVNPVFRYGIDRFVVDAREAGVDGLILPDLPLEEAELVANAAAAVELDLVALVAPNTPGERVSRIDRASRGFVYAVSVTGLTGTGLGQVDMVVSYLERIRPLVTRNPLLVGFGISSATDARRLSAPVDGFIVGSALIREIERVWQLPEADRDLTRITRFVAGLRP